MAGISDQLTSTNARLNLIVDDQGSVEALEKKIMASAQRSRASYLDTASAVAKMASNAGAAFDHDNNQVIAFMEQVNKQFVIGGASAEEQKYAMVQLTQAMASGALRGEELNSVLEQAPGIARAIEQYMGIAEGTIKSAAEDGEVTAQTVKNALFSIADETNAKFESMPMTWAQIWTSMQNKALSIFSPILTKLNEIANSDQFSKMIDGLLNGLAAVSKAATVVFGFMTSAAAFIVDNWSLIAPIIYGIAGALGVYLIATKGVAAATKVWSAAQAAFNAVMALNPVFLIIMGIILLIAAFYAVVAIINKVKGTALSATGLIAGAIATLGAFIWNYITGIVNAIIQMIWSAFVEPFLGIIEWILNVCNGGFDSFGDAVKNLLGNIISWFLSLGKVVTKIIDAIFGTDWTSGLSSLQDKVLSWGKNEKRSL